MAGVSYICNINYINETAYKYMYHLCKYRLQQHAVSDYLTQQGLYLAGPPLYLLHIKTEGKYISKFSFFLIAGRMF